MGINQIRKQSNAFVRNLEVHISQSIENVSDDIVDLNRKQMLRGKRSDEQKIVPKYSKRYAKRKGFTTPNLKLEGDFQDDMDLIVNENQGEVVITSFDYKNPFLVNRYTDKIFGIPKTKQQTARTWTLGQLARLYNRLVLNA